MTDTTQNENSPPAKKWPRRRLVVNPKIQYTIVIYAISLGIIMFSMGALFTLAIQRVIALRADGLASVRNVDIMMIALLVTIFWAWIYIGLVISNNVVGPIFRIIKEMEKMKDGQKLIKVVLRKKDFFSDLAHAYNDIIDQVNKNNTPK